MTNTARGLARRVLIRSKSWRERGGGRQTASTAAAFDDRFSTVNNSPSRDGPVRVGSGLRTIRAQRLLNFPHRTSLGHAQRACIGQL